MNVSLCTQRLVTLGGMVFLCLTAHAQSTGSTSAGSNTVNTPRPFDPGSNTTNPSALAEQAQNPFLGSVPTGPLIPGVLPLSLHEAVSRALRANLGLIDSEQNHAEARAARIRALSTLLPQLSADAVQDYRNIVDSGIGLKTVLGPYNFQTAHIYLTQRVLDVSAIRNATAAQRSGDASNDQFIDSRNIVVLAATSSYLLVAGSQVRLETARAELATAAATDRLVQDRVAHDVSPQIEGIRAEVVRRSAEQRVAIAYARFEKDKLALTRIIGLPIAQEFQLTDSLIYTPAPDDSLDDLVAIVKTQRQDIRAAKAQLEAAKESVKAQSAERLPTLEVRASVGETGFVYAKSTPDYEVAARIAIPIFTGRRIESDILTAKAVLHQREAELADIQARAVYDVRTALLDLKAAEASVEVSNANLSLAREGLRQARDRFLNGVTNSVDLVQAQQDVAEAEDNRIASVYAHSLAKLMLIRATGTAEANYLTYLGVR
ncbi:TolC family protein [Tunturiibacter empetritectus]|uniref:Outer membrane protein TolC n=1 Tax=Tunturiibacter lichenicola TaxID=2051959 RepID=A0A852V9B1_9BACT|nr:TolC family protein [Edaphobacter lichenicola]NYF87967.1 outer membrane protein TolC [Edaphobacter lichenicola]